MAEKPMYSSGVQPQPYVAQPQPMVGQQPYVAQPMMAQPVVAQPVMVAGVMAPVTIADQTHFNFGLCNGECCSPCDLCCMAFWCNPCLWSNTMEMLQTGQPVRPCEFSHCCKAPDRGALVAFGVTNAVAQSSGNCQACLGSTCVFAPNFGVSNIVQFVVQIAYAVVAQRSRTSIMAKYGIQDNKPCCTYSCCCPCGAWYFCTPCAACQEYKEVRLRIGAPIIG